MGQAGAQADLLADAQVVEFDGQRVHALADSGVDARVNVRIIGLVVALIELAYGLRGYHQVVFVGETTGSKATGKAVVDVMVIGTAGGPFVETFSSAVRKLAAASTSVGVAGGGLSAGRSSQTGLVPDLAVERTYEV